MKKVHGIDELNTVIQKTDNNHKWGRNKNLYVCIDIFSSLDIDAKKTITKINMTSLLTHTVAHSTRPSSMPKANNQPLKKFLSLAVS